MSVPTLDGITAQTITTPRLTTRVLFSGPDDGIPVVFAHGNASSATYWEEVMLALPDGYRGIAPDQRGYGDAEISAKIDATRGIADWSDDLKALLDALGIQRAHVVGHSAGGNGLWRYLMDYSETVISATMIAPGSPYGFGGTQGLDGQANYPDFAGCGGGAVNPDFPRMVGENERGTDNQMAPRNVMRAFYFKPPFVPEREEDLLSSLLSTHVGEEDYPGDMTPSENWPNVAPGTKGLLNALTPKYLKPIEGLYSLANKPPILWVRGSDDQIVSDQSMFDMGTLGQLGAVPGWPGADVVPPQPMIGQTRAVLEAYARQGGRFEEIVMADTGHSPYIEKPEEFNATFHAFIKGSQA